MTPAEKRPSFWAHAEKAQERVNQWPEWKREAANARLVSEPVQRRDDPKKAR
jgi:hypothetical protein